jgi:hypothetical protein
MFHKNLAGADLHAPSNYLVENDTGTAIGPLIVVTYTGIGTSFGFPAVRPISSLADPVRGVTMAGIPITSGSNAGYITSLGFLINVNTNAWPIGTQLYADTSGNLTTTVAGALVATVYKQDPINGYLYVEGIAEPGGGSGSGNVIGPASSTDTAIAAFDGTTGKIIQNSPYSTIQPGGAVQAQAFVFNTQILNDVTVPNEYAMTGTDIQLVSGNIILEGNAQLILL